jgi:hypothetical protein
MTAGNAPEQQPLVEQRKDAAGVHAGFMDAAKRADGERRVQRCRQAFAGDIAHVQANRVVAELEMVEIIAAAFRYGLDSYEMVTPPTRKGCAGSMTF